MYIQMQVFNIRNKEKAHHSDPSISRSTKERLPHRIWCGYATSPIQERQALMNQSMPHGCHKDLIKGSLGDQTASKYYMHWGPGSTCKPPVQRKGPAGPTWGWRNSGFDRTDLGLAFPRLPHGDLPLILRCIPGVRVVNLSSEPGHSPPINKRGEENKWEHTLSQQFSPLCCLPLSFTFGWGDPSPPHGYCVCGVLSIGLFYVGRGEKRDGGLRMLIRSSLIKPCASVGASILQLE
jgi:hypothetical protein